MSDKLFYVSHECWSYLATTARNRNRQRDRGRERLLHRHVPRRPTTLLKRLSWRKETSRPEFASPTERSEYAPLDTERKGVRPGHVGIDDQSAVLTDMLAQEREPERLRHEPSSTTEGLGSCRPRR